ncbi:MAG: helix-turn-helix transcriptional regulator, partial [Christensenellales bacterium]|nr:helix-turn-helix transcriptional regulator [Christensenellales bacterium]
MNIKEIAQLAGVSVATISRVLNHPEQVLPETRERVLAIMEANDYTPNWFARGLNLGRTNTIALLLPNIQN